MAEFILHTNEDDSPYGAIYRDEKQFFAFGAYFDSCYDENGDLNALGEQLADPATPLMGYLHRGTYSKSKVSWEKDATPDDIEWLDSLPYT